MTGLMQRISHHCLSMVLAYVAAVGASVIMLTTISIGSLLATGSVSEILALPFAVMLALLWFTMGAVLFVLPAIIVAYPIALVAARYLPNPLHTAAAGILIGPVVGTAATLGFIHLTDGPSMFAWTEQALSLAPMAAAAGGAIGWTVSAREE